MTMYKKRILVCALVIAGVLAALNAFDSAITPKILYGSYAYTSVSDMFLRCRLYITSFIWIMLFLAIKPFLKNRIPAISEIGKNTLCVYLLHGFFMRAGQRGLIPHPDRVWLLLLCAAGYVCLLGNRYTARIFQLLIPTRWHKK